VKPGGKYFFVFFCEYIFFHINKRKIAAFIMCQTLALFVLVLSGVAQGSVLGPILFLIFINDLYFGIKNWILKFVDDTKIFGRISSKYDKNSLQEDLSNLVQC